MIVLAASAFVVGAGGDGPVAADGAASAQGPVQDGAALVAALGCAGCHTGIPSDTEIRGVAPPLATDEVPLAPAYVFNYLADPQTVRPDIGPARMPRFDLSERERLALALFVTNEEELRGVDDAFRAAQGRHPDVDRDVGRVVFDIMGCAGCHVHAEVEPEPRAPDLGVEGGRVRGDWLRTYLADPTTIRPSGPEPGIGGRMPDFRLTPAEVETVATYLEQQDARPVPAWEPDVLSPFSMVKAETLMRERWSCLGCHQLGEDGGRIGPRLDGVRDRLKPSFVRAFIENPGHLAAGTVMPTSLEQPDRLDLMASYILQRDGPWEPGEYLEGLPAVGRPGSGADAGELLYQRACAMCHGVDGQGDGFNAPFLPVTPTLHGDGEAMSLRPDDTLYDGIYAGGWILGKSHRMPAFGASLESGEIRALVAYIRELCQCQGPAWSRDGRRIP